MKGKHITLIGTALSLALSCNVANAQSSKFPELQAQKEAENSAGSAQEKTLPPDVMEILCRNFPLNSRCPGGADAKTPSTTPSESTTEKAPTETTTPDSGTQITPPAGSGTTDGGSTTPVPVPGSAVPDSNTPSGTSTPSDSSQPGDGGIITPPAGSSNETPVTPPTGGTNRETVPVTPLPGSTNETPGTTPSGSGIDKPITPSGGSNQETAPLTPIPGTPGSNSNDGGSSGSNIEPLKTPTSDSPGSNAEPLKTPTSGTSDKMTLPSTVTPEQTPSSGSEVVPAPGGVNK